MEIYLHLDKHALGHALSYAIPECNPTIPLLECGSRMRMRVKWLIRSWGAAGRIGGIGSKYSWVISKLISQNQIRDILVLFTIVTLLSPKSKLSVNPHIFSTATTVWLRKVVEPIAAHVTDLIFQIRSRTNY